MSTDPRISLPPPPVPVGEPLTIRQVAETLVSHYGLHEGLYDLYLEYQFALGNFGPNPAQLVPSAVIGLAKLGLTKVEVAGPLTVDAAAVNPLLTPAKKRSRTVK